MPRAKKDPNKPKGVKSAYICFTEHEKKKCDSKGETVPFAEMSKLCGAKWKEMGDEEKTPFVKSSEKDRKRYEKEMENYIPPSDSDSEEERPKKKKKKEKDPNAPKKNITAYFHFAADKRPILKAKDSSLGITDVAVKIGEMWRNSSAAEKAPYEKKAAEDKKRYLREFEEYNASK